MQEVNTLKQEQLKETVKIETNRLKELIHNFTDEDLRKAIRGERPEGVDIKDFKVIRKSMQDHINNHIKGKMIHVSSQMEYNDQKKPIGLRTNTKPYKKQIKTENNGTQS